MAGVSVLWVLAVAVLAALASLFHYWHRREQPIWYLPFALRFLAYLFLGLLLLNPVSEGMETVNRKPRVWLVVDQSSSVRDDTAAMGAWQRQFQERWAPSLDLEVFGLAGVLAKDSVPVVDKGRTRLDALPESLLEQTAPVDAVVLLSDGQWNSGTHVLHASWPNETRLYTVPFGRNSRVPQVLVERWTMNPEVPVDEVFRSQWVYRLQGNFPSNAEFAVYHQGKLLGRQALSKQAFGRVNMEFALHELGDQVLEARVVDAAGKQWYRGQKTVRVLEAAKHIAVVYRELHPDVGAMARSLKASKGNRVTVQSCKDPLPENLDLVLQFGLGSEDLAKINKGVPVWHFPDPTRASESLFSRLSLRLPQSGTWQGTGYWTAESEEFLSAVEEYPPLLMPVVKGEALPGPSQFMKQHALGSATAFPLGFYTQTAGLEEAWFLGKGLWRWRAACFRRSQSFDAFDRWVLSVSRRLMAQNGARTALQLRVVPENPNASEPFSVRLWKLGADGQPNLDGEFSLRLERRVGTEWKSLQEAFLSRNTEAMQASFSGLDTGEYRLLARHSKGSSELQSSKTWRVEQSPLEPLLGADTALLSRWALAHSGFLLTSEQSPELGFPESKIEEQWTEWPWRSVGWILLVLVGLLSGEWVLRKWLGHI